MEGGLERLEIVFLNGGGYWSMWRDLDERSEGGGEGGFGCRGFRVEVFKKKKKKRRGGIDGGV